jgi:chloramphenicol-sensitive protein RarD
LFKGIFYTSIASIFWGLPQPLYYNEIKFIPAFEIVSHRSIWSFFFLLIIILSMGKINEFFNIFRNRSHLLYLSLTGLLIACNWTGFVLAVNLNRVQDASMGYLSQPHYKYWFG